MSTFEATSGIKVPSQLLKEPRLLNARQVWRICYVYTASFGVAAVWSV